MITQQKDIGDERLKWFSAPVYVEGGWVGNGAHRGAYRVVTSSLGRCNPGYATHLPHTTYTSISVQITNNQILVTF